VGSDQTMYGSSGRGPQLLEPTPSVFCAQHKNSLVALRQIDGVIANVHFFIGIRESRNLKERGPALRHQSRHFIAGERAPTNILMVARLHRLGIRCQLLADGTCVEADIGTAHAVDIVFHRAAAKIRESVKPPIELEANSDPCERNPLTMRREGVRDSDASVAANRIDRVVLCSPAIRPP